MESHTIVEHQNQEIRALKDNEELVTKKINSALEQENQTLMNEIDRLKRLPDELRMRENALKVANKEMQETKLTLKSLLLDIESGLETCENISGELQQERKRAFHTLSEIDEEKRKGRWKCGTKIPFSRSSRIWTIYITTTMAPEKSIALSS